MCGIVGIIRKNSKTVPEDIRVMADTLSHRGPDDYGVCCHENWGIGHRRLSIIDLASGHQPMVSENGNFCIVFNGEIYNYVELREELIARGYHFKTKSDTEVIINAYQEWQENCLTKLRGMFAFSIVDLKQKKMFIARDYLGIKPVVFFYDKNTFAFASELQAIKAVKEFIPEIDIQAIDQYLHLQYIPAPKTIYKNVYKLLPGHYITIDFEFNMSEQKSYYDFMFQPVSNLTKAEFIDELDRVLRDSVEKHLVSDVDYGAFLSGGIDSSMIVNYMSQILNKPVKTFSIGFENDSNSELEYAKYVSEVTHSEHHFKVIGGDALKILPDLVQHYGEPFGDSSAIPTYYVSELASDYVKMVLTGDGADEMFAGYPRYGSYLPSFSIENQENVQSGLKDKVAAIKRNLFGKRMFIPEKMDKNLGQWLDCVTYMQGSIRHPLWRKEYRNVVYAPLELFECEFKKTRGMSAINTAQYLDLKTYLPYDILTKVDIASMIHSLETRTPFVDVKVLEFALSIPDMLNWDKSEQYGFQGKMLLKKILGKNYSESFLYRKKRGFSMPLQSWFDDRENYAFQLKNALTSKDAKINEFFCAEEIKKIVQGNSSGNIWLLVFLEEWLQQNTRVYSRV